MDSLHALIYESVSNSFLEIPQNIYNDDSDDPN